MSRLLVIWLSILARVPTKVSLNVFDLLPETIYMRSQWWELRVPAIHKG